MTDEFRNEENKPFVSRVDAEAEWMERTGVLAFEDALEQLHTDHVPMAGTILQFRRRTGRTPRGVNHRARLSRCEP